MVAVKRLLIVTLCASLVLLGAPIRTSAGPVFGASRDANTYAALDGEVYRVDTHHGPESFKASILAVTPGQRWKELISWSVTRTPDRLTTVYRVGLDQFSMSAPRSLVVDPEAGIGETIEVAVNGYAVVLQPEEFHKLASDGRSGLLPDPDELPPALASLADHFFDGPAFMQANVVASSIVAKMEGEHDTPSASPMSCIGPCLKCAASVLGWVASVTSLIVTCGSSIPTGGAVAIACIQSFLMHQAANMVVIGSCVDCAECGTDNNEGLHPDLP